MSLNVRLIGHARLSGRFKIAISPFFDKMTKNMDKLCCRIGVSLIMIVCLFTPIQAQESLVFTAPVGPTPLSCSRVIVKAYQQIGIQVQIDHLPAARALVMSNKGQVDGAVARIKGIDKQFSNLIMIPIPVCSAEEIAFTKGLDFSIAGWESLKPYYVGTRTGSRFSENGTQGMNRTLVAEDVQLFRMLYKGRIDIAIISRLEGLQQIKNLKLKNIIALKPPLATSELYHYLHKKNESLIPKITTSLRAMKANGTIQRIRDQFAEELRE